MSYAFPPAFLKNILYFFIFISSLTVYTQEKDSLQNYSYEKLDSLFDNSYSKNILQSKKYAEIYLKKALEENNYIQQGKAYKKLAVSEARQDHFDLAHKFIDSAILLSKEKIKDNDLISDFLNYKGIVYYNAVDYQNAIKLYIEASGLQKGNRDSQINIDIAHNIAILKSNVGDEEEAKQIFKNNYNLYTSLEKNNSKSFSTFSYVGTLIALSDTYLDEAIETKEINLKNRLLDSATYYNNIGFEKSEKYNDTDGYNYFLIRKAIIAFEKESYSKAIIDFNLALQKANKIDQTSTLTTIYFYLAKCNQKLDNLNESILFYKKLDSISNADTEQSIYLPETYLALANLYKKKLDADNALRYYDLYAEIDKINDKKTIEIRKKIHEKYDLDLLEEEIQELKKDNKMNYTKALIIIVFLIFIFLIFVINSRKKQRKNRLVFEDLIKQLEVKKKESLERVVIKKEVKSKITIDEEKIQTILIALEKFEQKKQYLDINCDLAFVAKKVKTNKAYLSKVIHSEKQQKFIQYITTLRIDYALEKLKEDRLFRSYDIKSIASELGFKSSDSFSRAFKNKTGIYPSYYIKNINKINTSENK